MHKAILLLVSFIVFTLSCCGGDESNPPQSGDTEVLHWVQPEQKDDNTYMNPLAEVARFDIYLSLFPTPLDNELVANVAGVDNNTLVTSFDLALLRQYGIVPTDNGSFVFVKCVLLNGDQSEFSLPVLWE